MAESDLAKAERLCEIRKEFKDRDDHIAYENNRAEGIDIYMNMCDLRTNPNMDTLLRIKWLLSFMKRVPEDARDIIARFRDSLRHIKGEVFDKYIQTLFQIGLCADFDPHERLVIADTFHRLGEFEMSTDIFSRVAEDEDIELRHRVEACRYLYVSEDQRSRSICQDCLISIIERQSYPSEYRYSIIVDYCSVYGIATTLSSRKFPIEYSEEFVYGLQNVFFFEKKNGVRERILSGQHMLGMTMVEPAQKNDICTNLLEIAQDTKLDTNIRADATDVIIRLGTDEFARKARDVLTDLSFLNIDKNSVAGKMKTIYDNEQNVHDEKINDSVSKFIEKMFEGKVQTRPFADVYREVMDLVRSKKFDPVVRMSITRALNRVSVDSARFTSKKVTISEIFVQVWDRIQAAPKEKREMYETDLLFELEDMSDTCSSGHSSRFVNVIDDSVRITWEDQINANIKGRIQKRMREDPLNGEISIGLMENATDEEKKPYLAFLERNCKPLYQELYQEFVGDGYISKKDFNKYFENSWTKLHS